jgi:hypothetical protein
MPITFDRTKEYLIWDYTEAVSYTVYGVPFSNGNNYEETFTIAVAKRSTISNRDVPSQRTGIFTSDDLVWNIPQALIPIGKRPNPNDYITDSEGRRWTVLDTTNGNRGNTWRLTTRNLILAENLRQTISLQRPANTKDAAGGRVASGYTTILSNVPARIQETGATSSDILGKKQVRTQYDCHCGQRLNWKSTDRIVDQNNAVYQITSGAAPDIIDVLQVLSLERIS